MEADRSYRINWSEYRAWVRNRFLLILLVFIVSSCSATRKITEKQDSGSVTLDKFCDSVQLQYKSLYINNIEANLFVEDEEYNAKISVYYQPDSIFFVSGINSGFEIVRIGMTKDSIVYINRLDKIMVILNTEDNDLEDLITFEDVAGLLDKKLLCTQRESLRKEKSTYVLDYSSGVIRRKLTFDAENLHMRSFEFFQKKTSEYIVGELNEIDSMTIYSNFLVDEMVLKTHGGDLTFNKKMNINLEVNRRKYEVIHL